VGPGSGAAISGLGSRPFQIFTVRGADLTYIVTRWIRRKHNPVVTLYGPIRYSVEYDKFWILDEKNRYYEMKLFQKMVTRR
jgi:hypothetical protein